MSRPFSTLLACALLLSLLAAAALSAALDDAKDLKSKDAAVRLMAVTRIATEGGAEAGSLLERALKDDDWEVVVLAAKGLGKWGDEGSVDPLVKLAWDGPIARVRAAAARSAGQLDAQEALKGLAKKLSGDRALKVCEALALVLAGADDSAQVPAPKALEKLLKAKDTLTRAAAARALVLASGQDRAARLTELLDSEYTAVVAAALEAAALDPRLDQIEVLTLFLERPQQVDVLERRAQQALVASVGVIGQAEVATSGVLHGLVVRLGQSCTASVVARSARLAEQAAKADWFERGDLAASLDPALHSADPAARAAATRALAFAPRDQAIGALQQLGEADPTPRVRRAAVAAALTIADATDEPQRAWILKRLKDEPAAEIREDLAVALGLEQLNGVEGGLIAALSDPDWGVAVCAAISLGRTRSSAAIAPLVALTQRADDWRLRGAGVVGLCHAMRSEAIASLIECLADPEPLVARTTLGFLKTISNSVPTSAERDVWAAWWVENEKRTKLVTPKEAAERREKYGYAISPAELYAGLDVMVFLSRGDHIETVLDFLGIQYRGTSSNQVQADALDAAGVFVSNCTGEMQAADVERLRWFTKAGGYLFGSCWALHETIERVAPGAVRKLETSGEVLDQVTATACDPTSPYLNGVFPADVVPIYHLVGAHLVEVLEPERVEVLVDSAECAERWGGGDLAVWYRVGHGRILASVNHFEAQGLAEATGLKSEEDRMAYAVDHMGISLAKIRATHDEKWWSGSMKAAREIRDLSVFTLITNFVRARRIESY